MLLHKKCGNVACRGKLFFLRGKPKAFCKFFYIIVIAFGGVVGDKTGGAADGLNVGNQFGTAVK